MKTIQKESHWYGLLNSYISKLLIPWPEGRNLGVQFLTKIFPTVFCLTVEVFLSLTRFSRPTSTFQDVTNKQSFNEIPNGVSRKFSKLKLLSDILLVTSLNLIYFIINTLYNAVYTTGDYSVEINFAFPLELHWPTWYTPSHMWLQSTSNVASAIF